MRFLFQSEPFHCLLNQNDLHTRHNIHIMKVIALIMGFPLLLWMFHHVQQPPAEDNPEPILDTTLIAGYSFFREKGLDLDLSSNILLYNAIYPLLGTPHRSRNSRDGLDCSGLVKKIYHEVFGVRLPGSSRDLYRMATEITREDLREGDLVFFRINSNQINHVGIYLGNNRFVHASTSSGVEINDLTHVYYNRWYYKSARMLQETP